MTHEEHRAIHIELHLALDLLIADYLIQKKGSLLSNTTLMDLVKWSHAQTVDPTFTCSRCGAISHNPNDAEQQFCGACHAFLDDPSPVIPT